MYMAIHAAGVVHEDIDWRHIVLRGESKASANVLDPSFDPENLALIDWNMSHVRTTQSDADWQRITESELYAVATLPRGDPEDMNLSKFEEEVFRRYAIAYPDDDDDDMFSDEEVETVDDNLASKNSYDIAERLSESELNPARNGDERQSLGVDAWPIEAPLSHPRPASSSCGPQGVDLPRSEGAGTPGRGFWRRRTVSDGGGRPTTFRQRLSRVTSKISLRGRKAAA